MWLKTQREDGIKGDSALTLGWTTEEVRDMIFSTGNALLYPDLCSFLRNPSYNFTLHHPPSLSFISFQLPSLSFISFQLPSLSFSFNMSPSNSSTTTSHTFFTLPILYPSFHTFHFSHSAGWSSRWSRSRGRQDHRWIDSWHSKSSILGSNGEDCGSDHTSTGKLLHATITLTEIFNSIDLPVMRFGLSNPTLPIVE